MKTKNSIPTDNSDNNITKPENVGVDTRPAEPNDNDKDAAKPQDGAKKKAARNQIRIKRSITQFHSRIMQITVPKSLRKY